MPWCARLTSPGRTASRPPPPPMIAAADAVWCGARNGGQPTSGRPGQQPGGQVKDARDVEHRERELGEERAGVVPASSCPCPADRRAARCGALRLRARARDVLARARTSARSGYAGRGDRPGGSTGGGIELSAKVRARFDEMPEPYRLDAGERLCGRLGRAQILCTPCSVPSGGPAPRHRPQAPVEPELAQGSVTIEPLGRDLA